MVAKNGMIIRKKQITGGRCQEEGIKMKMKVKPFGRIHQGI